MADLMRKYREQVVAAKGRRCWIAEFRCIEWRRIDEPPVAIGVPVQDNPSFGRRAGSVELGDPSLAELASAQCGSTNTTANGPDQRTCGGQVRPCGPA